MARGDGTNSNSRRNHGRAERRAQWQQNVARRQAEEDAAAAQQAAQQNSDEPNSRPPIGLSHPSIMQERGAPKHKLRNDNPRKAEPSNQEHIDLYKAIHGYNPTNGQLQKFLKEQGVLTEQTSARNKDPISSPADRRDVNQHKGTDKQPATDAPPKRINMAGEVVDAVDSGTKKTRFKGPLVDGVHEFEIDADNTLSKSSPGHKKNGREFSDKKLERILKARPDPMPLSLRLALGENGKVSYEDIVGIEGVDPNLNVNQKHQEEIKQPTRSKSLQPNQAHSFTGKNLDEKAVATIRANNIKRNAKRAGPDEDCNFDTFNPSSPEELQFKEVLEKSQIDQHRVTTEEQRQIDAAIEASKIDAAIEASKKEKVNSELSEGEINNISAGLKPAPEVVEKQQDILAEAKKHASGLQDARLEGGRYPNSSLKHGRLGADGFRGRLEDDRFNVGQFKDNGGNQR